MYATPELKTDLRSLNGEMPKRKSYFKMSQIESVSIFYK